MSSPSKSSLTKDVNKSNLKISDVNPSRETQPHSYRFAVTTQIPNKDSGTS